MGPLPSRNARAHGDRGRNEHVAPLLLSARQHLHRPGRQPGPRVRPCGHRRVRGLHRLPGRLPVLSAKAAEQGGRERAPSRGGASGRGTSSARNTASPPRTTPRNRPRPSSRTASSRLTSPQGAGRAEHQDRDREGRQLNRLSHEGPPLRAALFIACPTPAVRLD